MSKEEGRRLLADLVNAIQSGNKEKIDKLKYDNLFYGSNLLAVIPNYIFLSEIGIKFDFGSQVIKKGTKLYRIRRFDETVDYSDIKQWSYPPSMPENRANRSGEAALYLGTTENVCVLETHIRKGEQYVLGEYEVTDDIILGGFLSCEDYKNLRQYLAVVILNAYLIAPSRSKKNEELFMFLDEYYKGYTADNLQIEEARKLDLPLKFGFLNKREEFYKTTNRLLDHIKHKHPEGISYSSCYIPAATIDIICSDSNVVLYKEGMNKIRFIQSALKVNQTEFTGLDFLKILVLKPNDKNE